MMKKTLLVLTFVCGLCGRAWSQDTVDSKEVLSIAGWAYFNKHDLQNKIELPEASNNELGSDEVIFLNPTFAERYKVTLDPNDKNRVRITGRHTNVVVIMKWENNRLASIRIPDRRSPVTYTVQQDAHHYTLERTFNNLPEPPLELWFTDGTISQIREHKKDSRPFKSGFVPSADLAFASEGQTLKVVSTRYRDGDLKKGRNEETVYTITDSLFRSENLTRQFTTEYSLRPDGQPSRSIDNINDVVNKGEYDYDERGRMIYKKLVQYRKSRGDTLDEERKIDFIGDKQFRETVKKIDSSRPQDNEIMIKVIFDKPDADTATQQEWEYKKGTYYFTLDNELIKVIQPTTGGTGYICRIKTDGVWGDWFPFQYTY